MTRKPSNPSRRPFPSPIRVRGRKDYARLSPSEQEARHRAFEAVTEMRANRLSLRAAAKFVGTTPATVRRYADEALIKEDGRYYATVSDRAYQRMSVLSSEGLVDIDTRGSRVRSLVGRHWNAVQRFGVTGDVAYLEAFEGKRAGGVALATDPSLIEEYLRQGKIDIDEIYA
jgi:hypothetical protein